MTREEKLPKWAQQEITVLRMRLEEAEKRAKIFSGEEKSNLGFRKHGIGELQYIPDNSQIVAFDNRNGITIRLGEEEKSLYICGEWYGLLVRPRGSNSIAVYAEE